MCSVIWLTPSFSLLSTSQLIVTPKYDPESNYGDLALLRLKKPITTKYVALATTTTPFTAKADVVGRGGRPGGKDASVMMYTQVSSLTTDQCNAAHEDILGDLPPAGAICFGKNCLSA